MVNKVSALILGTLLLLPALAIAQPTDLVTTHGRYFNYQNQTYEFIGFNIRGLAHYGLDAPLQYTEEHHIGENLDGAKALGAKVIRIFAANKNYSMQQDVDRLETLLDLMETKGLKAIVCFTDVYTTDFHPQGDTQYYKMQTSGWTLLDDEWFDGAYQNNYLPWVQAAVTQLKDHNAVFAWQLGNELTDLGTPLNIMDFTADVAAAIKAIDPYHMVTTGYISADHTQVGAENGVAMYNDPNIDFITVHSYNGEDPTTHWEVYARVEKPLVMEEFGWNINNPDDRPTKTAEQMLKWFDERNARGFMQWGYQSTNYDIGDGDLIFGIDPTFADYPQLASLYTTWAATLASESGPLPPLGLPAGENIAPDAVDYDTDSEYNSSYSGDKAIDGVVSPASKWTSAGSAPPHWLAVDLGEDVPISGFVVRMANDAAENRLYSFTDFEIQYGDSLAGPWTTQHAVENPTQYSVQILREDTPLVARYIRLLVNDPGGDSYARLPEFEVYAATTEAPLWLLY